MEWRDEGIILGTRKHGESSVIVEAMTQAHGRHLGLVRGGRSRRMQPVLQPGNRVDLVWRARLDEHLGAYQVEALELNAARYMADAASIHALQMIAAHLRLLPERDAHGGLYEALGVILAHLDEPLIAGELLVRFEVQLLDDLGFGLDLARCAATGTTDDLAYVSPKSGRAVSRAAGAPFADRMLGFPAFMQPGSRQRATQQTLCEAFDMTRFFLLRHVYEPRGMEEPHVRSAFVSALRRTAATRQEIAAS